jgi:hypothetical protein
MAARTPATVALFCLVPPPISTAPLPTPLARGWGSAAKNSPAPCAELSHLAISSSSSLSVGQQRRRALRLNPRRHCPPAANEASPRQRHAAAHRRQRLRTTHRSHPITERLELRPQAQHHLGESTTMPRMERRRTTAC